MLCISEAPTNQKRGLCFVTCNWLLIMYLSHGHHAVWVSKCFPSFLTGFTIVYHLFFLLFHCSSPHHKPPSNQPPRHKTLRASRRDRRRAAAAARGDPPGRREPSLGRAKALRSSMGGQQQREYIVTNPGWGRCWYRSGVFLLSSEVVFSSFCWDVWKIP